MEKKDLLINNLPQQLKKEVIDFCDLNEIENPVITWALLQK